METAPQPQRTIRFAGREQGAAVSFFVVVNAPGEGPSLHRHPYGETWHVLEGEATIRIGDDVIVATAGVTASVQPHVWHGFTNTGTGVLRIVCIHASDTIIQEFL